MTVYRVRLYGEVILTVTSEYHQQRMEHLASQTEAARSLASEYSIFQAVLLQSRKFFFLLCGAVNPNYGSFSGFRSYVNICRNYQKTRF
jgi:hypothetical protein